MSVWDVLESLVVLVGYVVCLSVFAWQLSDGGFNGTAAMLAVGFACLSKLTLVERRQRTER